jgi:hypothetical protein
MRSEVLFGILIFVSLAHAKEPKRYLRGKLVQMDSVACGTVEKDGRSSSSETIESDSRHKKTHDLLCREYVLQTEEINYRVRSRDEKHPILLPLGEWTQFRLQKDKMILRVDNLDDKEREYNVMSMAPRSDGNAAEVKAPHVNHLQ